MIFPTKKYDVIYIDPPWPTGYLARKKDTGKSFQGERYKTMKIPEILALPISSITKENCVIFMWTTNTFLHDALDIMIEWGFKYHACIVWNKDGGMTMRGFNRVTEYLLFGYKGSFPDISTGESIKTSIKANRLEHSEKPPVFRKIIEKRFPGEKIEMFARTKPIGWDVWGDEIDKIETPKITMDGLR
jgi:N6-adenosine-specific RNA methylase IME4